MLELYCVGVLGMVDIAPLECADAIECAETSALSLIVRDGGSLAVALWLAGAGALQLSPRELSGSPLLVRAAATFSDERSGGWLLNDEDAGVCTIAATAPLEGARAAFGCSRTLRLPHAADCLFSDAEGSVWACGRVPQSSGPAAITRLRRTVEGAWAAESACALPELPPRDRRVAGLSALHLGESLALLPPCFFDGDSGQPRLRPADSLRDALSTVRRDVLELAAAASRGEEALSSCDDGAARGGETPPPPPRPDMQRRVVLRSGGGALSVCICARIDGGAERGGGAGDRDGGIHRRAASPPPRAASSSLLHGVTGGLFSAALLSVRSSEAARAVEAAVGPAARAWAPAWLSAALDAATSAGAPAPASIAEASPRAAAATERSSVDYAGSGGGGGGSGAVAASSCGVAPRVCFREALAPPDYELREADKPVVAMAASPDGRLLLAVDARGRVALLDAADLLTLRLWKGYRGAQVAWARMPPPDLRPGSAAPPPWQLPAAVICIFAPQRRAIEVWTPHGGRLALARVPRRACDGSARLIAVAPALGRGAAPAAAATACLLYLPRLGPGQARGRHRAAPAAAAGAVPHAPSSSVREAAAGEAGTSSAQRSVGGDAAASEESAGAAGGGESDASDAESDSEGGPSLLRFSLRWRG